MFPIQNIKMRLQVLKMLLLKSDTEMYRGGGADDFLQCMISDISVDTQKATIFQKNYSNISNAIDKQRMSVSGVDKDEEAIDLLNRGINPLSFQGLKTSVTTDDSRAINFDEDCKVIISASGMCDAGRIKHHLKHNLWNPKNTVLFVGYQAIGTPGRALLEGATEMKLFGETVQVAAEICRMPGISGHADVNGLLDWARAFEKKPKHVFVTHGDDTVTEVFAQRLKEDLGYDATAPFSGTEYDLLENKCIHEAPGIRIVKATASPKASRAARAYEKLLAMGRRLMTVIRKNEGCPNKDLDRFARDIQSLCDKWDRDDI